MFGQLLKQSHHQLGRISSLLLIITHCRLTVPKWVLIVWPKMPKMLQNLSFKFVCPSSKMKKRLHWASVVRGGQHSISKNVHRYLLVAVGSSGILKGKQKLGVTFNSDKLGVIDFTKNLKLTMCSA
jgi:hypothetical protein